MGPGAPARFLVFVLLSAFACAAQLQPSDPAIYSVSGTVVNTVTGQAIPYALVQIEGMQARAVLADLNGHFRFDQLAAGQAYFVARKPGFLNEREMNRGPRSLVPVMINADTQPILVKLTPVAVISGRVEDENGDPVESAHVSVIAFAIGGGRKQAQPRGGGVTDDNGDYRIPNLQPGSYVVFAGGGNPRMTAGRETGYPLAVFYPGVVDYSSAAPLRLSAGQQLSVDFTLKRQPLYTVSGSISGVPAGQTASVALTTDAPGAPALGAAMDGSGSFHLPHVPAGRYLLTADAMAADGTQYSAEAPIEVTDDKTPAHLGLAPMLAIPVVVTTDFRGNGDGSQPRPVVRLREVERGPMASVQLRPLNGDMRQRASYDMRTNAMGERVPTLRAPPGVYQAQIFANGPYVVESATCGGVDLLRQPLPVTSTSPADPITVVLSDNGGNIRGSVRLRDAQDFATVLLYSPSAPMDEPRLSYASDRGEFSFFNLAPGDYSLLALDQVDDLEYANPEAMSSYLARATRVTVSGGATATVALEVMRRSQ